jgi:hypothetical protein
LPAIHYFIFIVQMGILQIFTSSGDNFSRGCWGYYHKEQFNKDSFIQGAVYFGEKILNIKINIRFIFD